MMRARGQASKPSATSSTFEPRLAAAGASGHPFVRIAQSLGPGDEGVGTHHGTAARVARESTMHMLMLVIVGLIVLGAFMLVAGLVNKRPGGGAIDGANVFIWVWLLASLVNAGVGYLRFNIALLNELGAFV